MGLVLARHRRPVTWIGHAGGFSRIIPFQSGCKFQKTKAGIEVKRAPLPPSPPPAAAALPTNVSPSRRFLLYSRVVCLVRCQRLQSSRYILRSAVWSQSCPRYIASMAGCLVCSTAPTEAAAVAAAPPHFNLSKQTLLAARVSVWGSWSVTLRSSAARYRRLRTAANIHSSLKTKKKRAHKFFRVCLKTLVQKNKWTLKNSWASVILINFFKERLHRLATCPGWYSLEGWCLWTVLNVPLQSLYLNISASSWKDPPHDVMFFTSDDISLLIQRRLYSRTPSDDIIWTVNSRWYHTEEFFS